MTDTKKQFLQDASTLDSDDLADLFMYTHCMIWADKHPDAAPELRQLLREIDEIASEPEKRNADDFARVRELTARAYEIVTLYEAPENETKH